MKFLRMFAPLTLVALSPFFSYAQSLVKEGEVINTITTAVPFLMIKADARSGGMGDVGVATPADANGLYTNPAKMAMVDRDYGFALTYTPWLRALVNDINLANMNGYYKIKDMQTIAMSLRYLSLGRITFTDNEGNSIKDARPNEFALDVHYARKLIKTLSIGVSIRFVYSNLAQGFSLENVPVNAGLAGAGDISLFWSQDFRTGSSMKSGVSAGMVLSNIGNKVSYSNSSPLAKDFLPCNLAIGVGYRLDIDKNNSVGVYYDLNKLLVPTPNDVDENNNGYDDFREKSVMAGIASSFDPSQAPGGVAEKFRELSHGIGLEYFYNKQFGFRMGYFYENPTKGARQFLQLGLTVKYSVAGLHFAYTVPTSQTRTPMDNTLRASLLFEFNKSVKKKEAAPTEIK